jgi:hypothetical protein
MNPPRYTLMSSADYHKRQARRRAAYKRYDGKHKDYRRADRHVSNSAHAQAYRELKMVERPFIFWDGEGPQDTGYSLFGNSAGYEVCKPHLTSRECLELITQTGRENPQAIHIAFGFNYDVSMMLRNLPHRTLRALAKRGKCIWKWWRIEHIPHKWFKVTFKTDTESITVKIYDIRTFFQGGYVSCLQQFNVGTDKELELLTSGKASRSEFMWADIQEIREYWLLELKLGPKLGDALRDSLYAASYLPRSWHGPGALARMALAREGVYKAMAVCPAHVRHASRMAYAGGRFDQYIIGEVNGDIYEADINSAYPYYATTLPNLARGKWRHGNKFEGGKFAVYHVRYTAKASPNGMYPLFRRLDNHMVRFPHRVEGWYWAPEAELIKDNPDAKILESLVFDEDDPTDRPFAFLAEYYRRRKVMDKTGDIAGYGYKILINAIYGQLAQRAGWDKKRKLAPRSHQLEWAGYITSACRAAVYKAAVKCGDKLISINTDSIMALCPLDDIVETGNGLGQWKTTQYTGGLFWQAGIYTLQENMGYDPSLDYGWNKAKTRGIPRGQYTTDELRVCIRTRQSLKLKRKTFITYALANMGQWGKLNTWQVEDSDYKFGGADGKRFHYFKRCGRGCKELPENMHRTTINAFIDPMDIESKPHYLPWLDGKDTIKRDIDTYMVDLNELDSEDEWEYDTIAVG